MTFDWLDKVYALVEANQIDDAIDILFEEMDLLEGDCVKVFNVVDLERLDTNLLVGLLSITLPRRHEMPERAELVKRVEQRLRVLAPERIEGLMKGLR